MAQDFLYLLEITRFVHDVLQLEKLFLAVLMNEQRLRLGGGCAVVVLRVKSLFAGEIFENFSVVLKRRPLLCKKAREGRSIPLLLCILYEIFTRSAAFLQRQA